MSYQNPIELYVIIEQIVDSIRSIGSVSAYSEVDGTYTITSDNTLVNNDWITIDSIQYKVTDVSETGFTIKGDTGLNFTNAKWKANAPYFMCEKEPKAGNILTEKTKQDTYKWQKYPLFLLTRPYTDDRSNRMIGYSTDFQLHIITDTESTYWSDDRIDNNFTPTLYPLYNAFMNALPLNRWVKEKYLEKINHSKTDSMFIDANPFPDKMDGLTIEFSDLEILKNRQICGIDTPQIYTVDLSSTTGGEAVSSLGAEGVYTNVAKDSNEAFNATAESGSRFVRWLLNGVENLTNPLALIIKKNYTIVAEFIESVLLTTSADGNGTITPNTGYYDLNETVEITATPNDEDTVLDRIEVDNIDVGNTSPYQLLMDAAKNVVAYFTALLTIIQDVFGNIPIYKDNKYYFEDQSGQSDYINIIYSGNSIQTQNNCATTTDIPEEVTELLRTSTNDIIEYHNAAIGSYEGAEMVANFAVDVLPYIKQGYTNYCFFFEIVNDIGLGGKTDQQAYDNMVAFGELCTLNNIIPIVCTAPNAPSDITDPSNTLIRNDNSFADYMIDLNSRLNKTIMEDNTYSCDEIHLNDTGVSYASTWIADQFISQGILTAKAKKRNNVQITNTTYLKLDNNNASSNHAIDTQLVQGRTFTHYLDFYFYPFISTAADVLANRETPPILGDYALYVASNEYGFFIITSNGNENFASIAPRTLGENKVLLSVDLDNKTVNININGTVYNINFTGNVSSITNTTFISGRLFNATMDVYDYRNYTDLFTSLDDIDNYTPNQRTILQEGASDELIDISTNRNDLLIQNGQSTQWDNSLDNLKPNLIYLGYTLFQQIADDTIYFRAPYDINGQITVVSKVGYNSIEEVPANVCSLSNEYLGIMHDDWELNKKTSNEMINEPVTSLYVPTKTANTVGKLIIKE